MTAQCENPTFLKISSFCKVVTEFTKYTRLVCGIVSMLTELIDFWFNKPNKNQDLQTIKLITINYTNPNVNCFANPTIWVVHSSVCCTT